MAPKFEIVPRGQMPVYVQHLGCSWPDAMGQGISNYCIDSVLP